MQILCMACCAWKDLTADTLAIRGWPHDPICKLCHNHPETVRHLLLDCSFTTTVRDMIFGWNGSIGGHCPLWDRTLTDGGTKCLQETRRRRGMRRVAISSTPCGAAGRSGTRGCLGTPPYSRTQLLTWFQKRLSNGGLHTCKTRKTSSLFCVFGNWNFFASTMTVIVTIFI